MAITAYPLNNIEYSAEDAILMNLPISSGVFADDNHFAISLSGGFSATISAGLGFIRYDTAKGFTFYMNTEESVSFDEPDTVLSRIDRVVLRWDESKNGVVLAVKKGTPSSTPVAVERETNSSIYELVLYDITIAANATTITVSNVVDQRKKPDLCGIMANQITNIDLEKILGSSVLVVPQSLSSEEKTQARKNIGAAATEDIPDTSGIENKINRSGNTMEGILKAQNNNLYATKQVRNSFVVADGEALPSGANGDICYVYLP